MNVEIGTEAAQFPEKEYVIGIFVAVQRKLGLARVHIQRLQMHPKGPQQA